MSQTKAQLIQPVGIFTAPGVNVSGTLTATTFSGNLTGNASSLAGTPNVNAGVLTATSFYGDGSNLTGVAGSTFVGVVTTSQSGTTTIDLSLGNVIYFTHDTDTTVAFANTETTQVVQFIRVKDDTTTARTITWPDSVKWNGGSAPTLIDSSSAEDVQIFDLLTRDQGVTWYGYESMKNDPAEPPPPYELWSWGSNSAGRLGLNDTVPRSSPHQIPGNTWSSVTAGNSTSLAIEDDGTLWGWGSNTNGQLGQNDQVNRSSPHQIPGTQWSSSSTARFFSSATKTDNTLWAWGYNNDGELSLNDAVFRSSPTQIPGTQWSFVDAVYFHVAAKKTDGTLWVWGKGGSGQLGLNNTVNRSSPTQIPGTQWSSISLNYGAIATKTDGTLWVWGLNNLGQLGLNNTVNRSSPYQIPGTQWNFVDSGPYYTLLTKTDGTLWSCGEGNQGQLGLNNTVNRSSPTQIPGTQWSSISLPNEFGYYSSAKKTDGTLWVWGSGGILGLNDAVNRSSPTQIPGTQWSSFSSGYYHALAIKSPA